MEMIFYIVLPWAVILFLRNRWIVTLPLLALATCGWLYLCRHSLGPLVSYDTNTVARYGVNQAVIRDFLARQFPAFFVDFGVGIVAANLYWQFKMKTAAYRLLKYLTVQWMGTLYFFLGCGIVVYSMNQLATHEGPISYYLKNISVAVGFVLMIAGMMAGSNWLQALFSIAPLRFIGIIGYSIFLWHMPLIYLFNKYPAIAALPPGERFARVVLLTSVAVLILGALSYLFVEKPFILMSRRRPVVAATYAAVSPREVVPSHIPADNPVAVGSRST